MAMATTTYEMVRGYHIYATVWDAQIGEELFWYTPLVADFCLTQG